MWHMMRRILWMVAIVVLALMLLMVGADHEGKITIAWFGYEVRMTAVVGVILMLATAYLLSVCLRFIWWVKVAPERIQRYFAKRALEQTIQGLNHTIIAFAQGDYGRVEASLAALPKDARHIDGGEILKAYALLEEGEYAKASACFQQLLLHKSTKIVALRGLLYIAKKQQDMPNIQHYLKWALQTAGVQEWMLMDLIAYYKAEGNVQKLSKILDKAADKALLDASYVQEAKTDLYFTTAKAALQQGNVEEAEKKLKAALKYQPTHLPATLLYAELLVHGGQQQAAFQLLHKAWKEHPHMEYIGMIRTIYAHETPDMIRKKYELLLKSHPNMPALHLALAKEAMRGGQITMARKYANTALQYGKTPELCVIMAELELRAGAESHTIIPWLDGYTTGGHTAWATRDAAAYPHEEGSMPALSPLLPSAVFK